MYNYIIFTKRNHVFSRLCSLCIRISHGHYIVRNFNFQPEDVTPNGAIDLAELCSYSGPKIDLGQSKMDDLAFMPYSSGTTGLPKGVLLTNRNITANLLQISDESIRLALDTTSWYIFLDSNFSTKLLVLNLDIFLGSWQDKASAVLPFYHIYGLVLVFLINFSQGVQLVTMPRFHPESYVDMIRKHKPTLLYTAPPIGKICSYFL